LLVGSRDGCTEAISTYFSGMAISTPPPLEADGITRKIAAQGAQRESGGRHESQCPRGVPGFRSQAPVGVIAGGRASPAAACAQPIDDPTDREHGQQERDDRA
jgi:hypothetical protein